MLNLRNTTSIKYFENILKSTIDHCKELKDKRKEMRILGDVFGSKLMQTFKYQLDILESVIQAQNDKSIVDPFSKQIVELKLLVKAQSDRLKNLEKAAKDKKMKNASLVSDSKGVSTKKHAH